MATGGCLVRSRPLRLVPRAHASTLFSRLSPGVICVRLVVLLYSRKGWDATSFQQQSAGLNSQRRLDEEGFDASLNLIILLSLLDRDLQRDHRQTTCDSADRIGCDCCIDISSHSLTDLSGL